MTQTSAEPAGLSPEAEEAGFYHEAALNATWTGARLAMGALSFGFGAFVFAYFSTHTAGGTRPRSPGRTCGQGRSSWG